MDVDPNDQADTEQVAGQESGGGPDRTASGRQDVGMEEIEGLVGREQIDRAHRALEEAILPGAIYSSMAQDFLVVGPDADRE